MAIFSKTKRDNLRVVEIFGFKFSYKRKPSPSNVERLVESKMKKIREAGYTVNKVAGIYNIKKDEFSIFGDAIHTLNVCADVLCNEPYNVNFLESVVMFDIGCNIGITSLYCAQSDKVKAIYAFEPFAPTYAWAQKNLTVNPKLADKITIFNFGLSDKNDVIEADYNPQYNGSMSTQKHVFSGTGHIEKATLKIASDILKPLFEKHSEKKFLKMDCEGAEWVILPDLERSGLLSQIDYIIMEWHFDYPRVLIETLAKSGFVIFTYQNEFNELGIIRAVKVT